MNPQLPYEREKVRDFEHLMQLRAEKRSVVFHGRPMPAAVACNMNAQCVHFLIKGGLEIYPKPVKSKPFRGAVEVVDNA